MWKYTLHIVSRFVDCYIEKSIAWIESFSRLPPLVLP